MIFVLGFILGCAFTFMWPVMRKEVLEAQAEEAQKERERLEEVERRFDAKRKEFEKDWSSGSRITKRS